MVQGLGRHGWLLAPQPGQRPRLPSCSVYTNQGSLASRLRDTALGSVPGSVMPLAAAAVLLRSKRPCRGRAETRQRPRGPAASQAAARSSGRPRAQLEGQDAVLEALERAEPSGGPALDVIEVTPGPGLANRHLRITYRGGDFLAKVSTGPVSVFEAEYAGLQALRSAAEGLGLVVPRPHVLGALPADKGSFLVLDFVQFVPFGPSIPAVQERLGHGLAMLHTRKPQVPFGAHYGFGGETFLGGSLQENPLSNDFVDFFVEHRLRPQLERAYLKFQYRYGTSNEASTALARLYDRVIAVAAEVLEPVRHCSASLLHGDLWSGNTGATPTREPILVDPACWYGHAEFDLAISQLFGRFGPRFYEAYFEAAPMAPGFQDRQQLYVLYHQLNQANLHGAGFGRGGTAEHPGGYLEQAVASMERLVA